MSESPRYILCPYCGHPQPVTDQCNACGGLFEPLSRKATQISMGPWYIRDRNSPFRPGCSYTILKKQVEAGRVKSNTVLRGPTTHQFWSVARNTPGVAHLLGYCHECNASVKPTDTSCPKCSVEFAAPTRRDELGLLYPTRSAAAKAQQALDREIDKIFGPGKSKRSSSSDDAMSKSEDDSQTRAPVTGGIDLLDQVLNTGSRQTSKLASSQTLPSHSRPASSGSDKPASLDFAPSVQSPEDADAARQAGEAGGSWKNKPSHTEKPDAGVAQGDSNPTAAVPLQSKSTGGSTHWLIWLLVASNIAVVGLLAAAVWLLKQPPA